MYRDEVLRLGSVLLRLRGDHPVLDLVLDELARSCVPETAPPGEARRTVRGREPDVELEVVPGPLPDMPGSAATLGPVTASGAAGRCRLPRTGFDVHFHRPATEGPQRISVAIGPRPMPFRIPRPLFRWVEPTFLTPVQAQAYVFMLRLVEGAVFLFGGDTALLHAACVERGGRAVALTSAGGVGKTGTAALLLSRPGWRYLSDDITFLPADGPVELYPRWVMVYAYNLRHDPGLRRKVVARGGWRGRLQWHALRALGVDRRRRRVPPDVLWGQDKIAGRARLELVVFLSRGSEDRLELADMDPADLARRSRAIMANEQAVLGEMVRLWEAAGHPPVPLEAALDRHRDIYLSRFRRVPLLHLRLPRRGPLDSVADVIEATLDGPGG